MTSWKEKPPGEIRRGKGIGANYLGEES